VHGAVLVHDRRGVERSLMFPDQNCEMGGKALMGKKALATQGDERVKSVKGGRGACRKDEKLPKLVWVRVEGSPIREKKRIDGHLAVSEEGEAAKKIRSGGKKTR